MSRGGGGDFGQPLLHRVSPLALFFPPPNFPLQEAKAAGAVLLCLPENFSYIGTTDTEAIGVSEPLSGPQLTRFKAIAKANRMWLSLGGYQEAGPDPSHRYNTHVVINSEGEVVSSYRKIHLFDINLPGGPKLQGGCQNGGGGAGQGGPRGVS